MEKNKNFVVELDKRPKELFETLKKVLKNNVNKHWW